MKKKSSQILIIAFIALILLPTALGLLLPAQENAEKRELAKKPVVGETAYTDYSAALNAYYDDHLPMRNVLVKAQSILNYELFDTAANSQVIVGADGWLFYNPKSEGTRDTVQGYMGTDQLTDEELSRIRIGLLNISSWCDDAGAKFVLMIVPDKERVYSEYMPSCYGAPSEISRGQQVADAMADTDIEVIYLLDDFLSVKQTPEGSALYYKHDSHWNGIGAYLATAALQERLGQAMPELSGLSITATPPLENDLAVLAGLGDYLPAECDYRVGEVKDFYSILPGESGDLWTAWHTVNPDADGKLMMVRDSFAMEMVPYLHELYGETLDVYRYDSDWTWYPREYIKNEAPDVFLMEVSESLIRDLIGYDEK